MKQGPDALGTEGAASVALSAAQLLTLLHLTGPTLPTGGFAYSQGLEYATAAGLVTDMETARVWICGLLEHFFAQLELPLYLRLHRAAGRGAGARFTFWDRLLYASRETRELREEESNVCRSLTRLVTDTILGMGQPGGAGRSLSSTLHLCSSARTTLAVYAAVFSWASVPPEAAALALGAAWIEQHTSAAVRLVPLGQTDGRRIVLSAAGLLPDLVRRAEQISARNIGRSLPGATFASMRHETMYTRLFLS